MDLLRPMSVVVTPIPFENEQMHDPTTMTGRFFIIAPAKRRMIERPIVRCE